MLSTFQHVGPSILGNELGMQLVCSSFVFLSFSRSHLLMGAMRQLLSFYVLNILA